MSLKLKVLTDNIDMAPGRPNTPLRHGQDDVQMHDASELGRAQASTAPDKIKLARKVQDCFEDINEKNHDIAKLLFKLRLRFWARHYKSICKDFVARRKVHEECLDKMKGLFMISSRMLPDSQDAQLVLDERGVSGMQQSLESLEENRRNLQILILVLENQRKAFGNQSRTSNSRAPGVSTR